MPQRTDAHTWLGFARSGRGQAPGPPTTPSEETWLELKRFEYRPLGSERALVQLTADIQAGLRPLSRTQLVVERLDGASSYQPFACRAARSQKRDDQARLLWRACFAVGLDVVEYPDVLYTLVAPGRGALALPAPQIALLHTDPVRAQLGGFPRARVRRHLIAVGTGLAMAAWSGLAVGSAAAAERPGHDRTTHPSNTVVATQAPMTCEQVLQHPSDAPNARVVQCKDLLAPKQVAQHVGSGHGQPDPVHHTTPSPPSTHGQPSTNGHPSTQGKGSGHEHSSGHNGSSGQHGKGSSRHKGKSSSGHEGTPGSDHTSGPDHSPGRGRRSANRHRSRHHEPSDGRTQHHASTPPVPHHVATPPPAQPTSDPDGHHGQPAAALPAPGPTPLVAASVSPSFGAPYSGPFSGPQLRQLSSLVADVNQPPSWLIPIYKAAAKRYHVPWRILAAINSIETDYGRDLSVSSAGAVGWMQFMPATWAKYGVAVDRRGRPNPYDPRDAIFAAARYLAANGGSHHLRQAIFAYNHALWYVDAVIWRSRMIRPHAFAKSRLRGYALPLDARYLRHLGRTDDGVDIETAPDGAGVYSITPGVVTAVASDPGGFGPNYPVIRVSRGPLEGRYIYYGHVAASLVKVGQHVIAGQPIAIMGHTGDAADLGHGHIEIGFSNGGGDPLDHHGATAWTPAGSAMRQVLVDLAAAFRIKTS